MELDSFLLALIEVKILLVFSLKTKRLLHLMFILTEFCELRLKRIAAQIAIGIAPKKL